MTEDLSMERHENGGFVLAQGDKRIALERGQAVNLARSIQFLALQRGDGRDLDIAGAPHVPIERFAVQTDFIGQIVFLRLFANGTELGYGLRSNGAHALATQLGDAARKLEVAQGDAVKR